jgi:hypothetical protein
VSCGSLCARTAKRSRVFEFVAVHVHAAAAKRYSFGLQAHPLLERILALQLDGPAGANDALPGQSNRATQRPGNLPGAARIPSGFRYAAIRGHFSTRNPQNRGDDQAPHSVRTILPLVFSHSLRGPSS